jgi:hypothetical protein
VNIIRRAWEWLYPPSGPKLRNKPGGMAWIRVSEGAGMEVLNGCAVKTVRLDGNETHWVVSPAQSYVATGDMHFKFGGWVRRGQTVEVVAIADECLEPWKDIGDDEADESTRYLPPVPTVSAPKLPQGVPV